MATRTSVGSGLWSSVGTWDTGVPVDGDDVVIASGHTITFDVDQSVFVTGVKVTITGTLTHTTAAGSYCLFLKTGASVVGAGTWNIGTSGAPIPFASKHTITGAAGWYVDGVLGLTMTVYGAEPVHTSIKLSADEAIGQTELSVDTDVTGDIWAAGDIIRIDDINKGQESEERIIATGGIAAGTITVTAGLTAAKSTGALVSLITRNIRIIAVGIGSYTIYRVGTGSVTKLTVAGGMWYGVNKNLFSTCHYMVVSGGVFSGNSNGVISCTNATVSGGVFSGNTFGLNTCTEATISGGTFSGNGDGLKDCTLAHIAGGTFSGNSNGVNGGTFVRVSGGVFSGNSNGVTNCTLAHISGGVFSGNTYGLFLCKQVIVSGGVFSKNTYDLRTVTGNMFDVTLTSAIEHYVYSDLSDWWNSLQSDNHDAVDGAVKAWCKGGVVTSQTAIKPDGYMQACAHALESASYPAFWYKKFTVPAGQTYSIEVQLRKSASMAYLPRVYLMAGIGNPLAGATPVDTFTMTDSIDTWESDTFTVDNSAGSYDLDYVLWFVGQNATGSVYSAYKLTPPSGGGGGAVRILPLLGRVGL